MGSDLDKLAKGLTAAQKRALMALTTRMEIPSCRDVPSNAFKALHEAHSAPAGEVVAYKITDADGGYWFTDKPENPDLFDSEITQSPLYAHPAPPADLVVALTNVRAQNAADMKRSGAVWEAYDRAVLDCIDALSAALRARATHA